MINVKKHADNTWQYAGAACVTTNPARPQITAELVRQQAVRLVPSASVGLAPYESTLVNIETVMWVRSGDRRTLAPIRLLGHRVVISLRLDHVAWDFGDGQSDRRGDAGKAYDHLHDPCRSAQCPHYYGHTYRATGSMTVAATVSWQASFTVDGGTAIAIPATVAGPTARSPLAVKQARAVLVPNPGDH